jgi:hypothetical protein
MARWEVGWWVRGDGSKEVRVGVNALIREQGSGRNYTDCNIHSRCLLGGNRFRGFFMTFYWRHNDEYYLLAIYSTSVNT